MKWASAISEHEDTAAAIAETASALARQLGDAEPDLVIAFVSPHHADAYDALPAGVEEVFPHALVFGCSASGVIGNGHEVEARPALSLTAARLPGVQLSPLVFDEAPEDGAAAWRGRVGLPASADPQFVILVDPFTCDADALVAGLDAAYPSGRKVGGLASGGVGAGENVLYAGRLVQRGGAVGVAMSGDIAVDTIVAQGCRPIGTPTLVTRADGHVIRELAGKPPVAIMRALYESLDGRDQELFKHSLFVGLDMDEGAVEFRGDFLVRNIVGVDTNTGAIAVGARVRPWQVVQFLLRDARTAERDLETHLQRYRAARARPAGALLFSCLGRGQHLFGRADHDTDLFRASVGAVPLGGFFCNGEIGPVGNQTFLHGYTSAFGLFRHK
jgi:small ligand-binding sensory domain FIST